MGQPIPSAATLLQAAASYLDEDLLPTLDGYHRFQTRVVIHVLRTVVLEIALAPAHDRAETIRLAALLQHGGDADAPNAELGRAIADGRMALDDPELLAHLRQTLRDALAINNPKWT